MEMLRTMNMANLPGVKLQQVGLFPGPRQSKVHTTYWTQQPLSAHEVAACLVGELMCFKNLSSTFSAHFAASQKLSKSCSIIAR